MLRRLLIFSLCLGLSGCTFNVAGSSTYPTDYVVGETYRLLQPLVAWGWQRRVREVVVWVPKDDAERRGEFSGFAGHIPTGTRLVVTAVKFDWNPEAGNSVEVEGRFLDGPLAGKKVHLAKASRMVTPPTPPDKWRPDVPWVDARVLLPERKSGQ